MVGDAKAGTVTINLIAADPEFMYKLARPARVRPAGERAAEGLRAPSRSRAPAPYMFTSLRPEQALMMVRNPHFEEWSHDAQPAGYPDEIDYDFGLTAEAQITAVENGQADWMFELAAGRPARRARHEVREAGAPRRR